MVYVYHAPSTLHTTGSLTVAFATLDGTSWVRQSSKFLTNKLSLAVPSRLTLHAPTATRLPSTASGFRSQQLLWAATTTLQGSTRTAPTSTTYTMYPHSTTGDDMLHDLPRIIFIQ